MSASGEWRALGEELETLRKVVKAARGVNISAREDRDLASEAAQLYFRRKRRHIEPVAAEEAQALDKAFQALLTLSSATNRKTSYVKHLKAIQKLYPRLTGKLALGGATTQNDRPVISPEDQRIASTLEGLLPNAARSFKQALIDLTDTKRFSYRRARCRAARGVTRNAGLPRARQGSGQDDWLPARSGGQRSDHEAEGQVHLTGPWNEG